MHPTPTHRPIKRLAAPALLALTGLTLLLPSPASASVSLPKPPLTCAQARQEFPAATDKLSADVANLKVRLNEITRTVSSARRELATANKALSRAYKVGRIPSEKELQAAAAANNKLVAAQAEQLKLKGYYSKARTDLSRFKREAARFLKDCAKKGQ